MTHIKLERGPVSTWPEEIKEDRDDTGCTDSVVCRVSAGRAGTCEDDRIYFRGGVSNALLVALCVVFVLLGCFVDYRALMETEADHYGSEERYHAQVGHGMAREVGR